VPTPLAFQFAGRGSVTPAPDVDSLPWLRPERMAPSRPAWAGASTAADGAMARQGAGETAKRVLRRAKARMRQRNGGAGYRTSGASSSRQCTSIDHSRGKSLTQNKTV
jgi:hypothetical protein